MKQYTVFKIVAFDVKTVEGNFADSCILWVYANTSKDAIANAKKYQVGKKNYQILEVIEKRNDDTT